MYPGSLNRFRRESEQSKFIRAKSALQQKRKTYFSSSARASICLPSSVNPPPVTITMS